MTKLDEIRERCAEGPGAQMLHPVQAHADIAYLLAENARLRKVLESAEVFAHNLDTNEAEAMELEIATELRGNDGPDELSHRPPAPG